MSASQGCTLENSFAWSTTVAFLGARELGALSTVCRRGKNTVFEFANWKSLTLRQFARVRDVLAVHESSSVSRDWRATYRNQLALDKSPTNPRFDAGAIVDSLLASLDEIVATLEVSIILEHDSFEKPKEQVVISRSMVPKFLEPEILFDGLWTSNTIPPLLAWYLRRNHCTSDAEYETEYGWINIPHPKKLPEDCELPCSRDVASQSSARLRLRIFFTKDGTIKIFDGEVDDYGSRRLFFDLKPPNSANPFYNAFAVVAAHLDIRETGLAGMALMMRGSDFAFDGLSQLWFFNDAARNISPVSVDTLPANSPLQASKDCS